MLSPTTIPFRDVWFFEVLFNDKGIVITFLWEKLVDDPWFLRSWLIWKHGCTSTSSQKLPVFILVELDPLQAIYHKITDHSSTVFDTLISNFWCALFWLQKPFSFWRFRRATQNLHLDDQRAQLLGDWLGCWKKSLEKQNSWCLQTKKQVATCLTVVTCCESFPKATIGQVFSRMLSKSPKLTVGLCFNKHFCRNPGKSQFVLRTSCISPQRQLALWDCVKSLL